MTMKIRELKRNDVDAAVQLYKERKASGTLDGSTISILFKLQDDPGKLQDALNKADDEE